MLLEQTRLFSRHEIAKTDLEFGVLRLFIFSLRPDLDIAYNMRQIKYQFESLRIKNAAFNLDFAFYICRIEVVCAVMGIKKFIFSSSCQVYIGDYLGKANAENGEHLDKMKQFICIRVSSYPLERPSTSAVQRWLTSITTSSPGILKRSNHKSVKNKALRTLRDL